MKKIAVGLVILTLCSVVSAITPAELKDMISNARKNPKENIEKLAAVAGDTSLTVTQKRNVYSALISGYYKLNDFKKCREYSELQLKDEKLPENLRYDALFLGGISAGNSGDLKVGCEMLQKAIPSTKNKNMKMSAMIQLIFLQVKARNYTAAEETIKTAKELAEDEDRSDWLARIAFTEALLVEYSKGKKAWAEFVENTVRDQELIQHSTTVLLCKSLLKYYVANKKRAEAEKLVEAVNKATNNKHAAQFKGILK